MKVWSLLMLLFLVPFVPVSLAMDEDEKRVLAFFEEYGMSGSDVPYPEGHPYWEEAVFYAEHPDAARSVVMYLLKGEYYGDYIKMASAVWRLAFLPGDQSEVLAFLRSELPVVLEMQDDRSTSGFACSGLSFLGRFGDESDYGLIDSFSNHRAGQVQSRVITAKKVMSARLRAPKQSAANEQEVLKTPELEPASEPKEKFEQEQIAARSSQSMNSDSGGSIRWFCVGGVALVGVFVFFMRLRRGQS
ncbi:hypothetical protein [Sulfuriroseicoccus oceanibius]|uniref:Uncharacterized protein n=1 Tax=Sulfuriroseicoccus oceanibius TaxID=2707525 RepID=A0A6B3L6N0_9BACT|nr:hypothetical protein [Sulfuriroseicoccus oceanibius]QQL44834.1 hypothetical protein G3M56_013290 [Sulfuriroseicoccus oceanibius]